MCWFQQKLGEIGQAVSVAGCLGYDVLVVRCHDTWLLL